MKQFISHSTDDLQAIAKQILDQAHLRFFVLQGGMGAGKTTLTKALVKALGSTDEVQSPTFSIVNEYHIPTGEKIYHFDFYRIDDEIEAMDMGYEDYFYSHSYCFVEWAEKIPSLLPSEYHLISLNLGENMQRIIEFN